MRPRTTHCKSCGIELTSDVKYRATAYCHDCHKVYFKQFNKPRSEAALERRNAQSRKRYHAMTAEQKEAKNKYMRAHHAEARETDREAYNTAARTYQKNRRATNYEYRLWYNNYMVERSARLRALGLNRLGHPISKRGPKSIDENRDILPINTTTEKRKPGRPIKYDK